jgi:LuxR family maltose regulon positive regulatory protein
LDNYEQISEPTVHSALNYLLRRLPSQARVVVSTTQDPPLSLTKMRAGGLATILRADTLAFDEVESAAFLDKVAGLSLTAAQKIALHRHAEGWPAALCLLAQELHALSHEGARIHYIASLDNGDEPPPLWPAVEAYLREELFDELPRQLRMFLMQSSILSTLSADVCKAVTGCQDAAELLQVLYQRNLFLFRLATPLHEVTSTSQPLFRYHTLFATFLRRRLYQEMPDEVPRLHQRAAEATPEALQKLRHYLAAHCWTEATQLLVSMKNGDWPGEALAKLAHISNKIPKPLYQALTARHRTVPPPAAMRAGLTARQFEVLALLDHGASNHAIAMELFITLATVKGHIGEIMRKLEVTTRREAVRRATELGLLFD